MTDVFTRPLFKVRTFWMAVFSIVALVGAQLGFPGLDFVAWAGEDSVMSVGELLAGLFSVGAVYFTKYRKPGAIEGIVSSPS